jgi:hypothetical protein
VGFQNPAGDPDLVFYTVRSYSLIRHSSTTVTGHRPFGGRADQHGADLDLRVHRGRADLDVLTSVGNAVHDLHLHLHH